MVSVRLAGNSYQFSYLTISIHAQLPELIQLTKTKDIETKELN